MSSVMRLDGPTIDTPAAYTSGVKARPASVALPAVRTAHDADALRIGDPFGDQISERRR